MRLLYIQEHTSCINYDKESKALIQIIPIEKQSEYTYRTSDHELVFVYKGRLRMFYRDLTEVNMLNGQFTLLPSLSEVKYIAMENSTLIVFRLRGQVKLCDRFTLEKLDNKDFTKLSDDKITLLSTNDILDDFLNILFKCHSDGMRCFYYSELKLKELFYILRAYYKKEDLASLFSTMLSSDIKFSDFIYQNYTKAKTVGELADIANYSLSGFEKRFKKTFGVSAGIWLNKKRAMRIYQEINCSSKPFKVISSEFGFSSPAHFNDYCKVQFNNTPGKIRKTSQTAE